MTLLFLYLFLALAVSFVCSVLEAVLLSSTHSYIATLDREKPTKGTALAMEIKSNIDRSISGILILNTFAHTMGAAGVGAQALKLFGEEWETLIAVVLTLLILYVSEIIPKTIGATHWKGLLIPAAFLIHYLAKAVYPLILLSTAVTRLFASGKSPESGHSRDEILAVVEMGAKEGSLQSREGALIENLLRLGRVRTGEIMTPRTVVFALAAETTVAEAVEEEALYTHSRIPVYRESPDRVEGMVFSQTVMEEGLEGRGERKMEEILRPVFQVSENLPVPTLLDQFIKRKEHLFMVHDGFGQVVGIVTLEDAIETLLGVEIVDEMDRVVDMQALARERSRIFHDRLARER